MNFTLLELYNYLQNEWDDDIKTTQLCETICEIFKNNEKSDG